MGLVSRALHVREGERRITLVVAVLMFESSAVMALGESAIGALFFDRVGTGRLPLMYVAQAGSTLVAMLVLTAVLGRVSHRLVYVWSPVALAFVVAAERAIVAADARWIYPVLWLTVAFATLAQAIGLWGTAGDVLDTRQAKRLFPIFGAGGILGAVVGGLLTRPVASLVGVENLLLVWAGGLVVASGLCRAALGTRAPAPPGSAASRGSVLRDVGDAIAFVPRSRLLMAMAAAAALFSVLFFSLFLPYATAAAERFPDADGLAGFLGLVSAAISGTAFLLSMLAANRLFARFGVPVMIVVLPLLYAGAFSILLFGSGLGAIVALRVATGVWLQGVASPAWEALINVVPDDRRDQTRAFLNGGPAQVGTAIAGLVALVGRDVLSARGFATVGLAAAILTLAVTVAIRRSYGRTLVQALLTGRPHVFERPSAWAPIAIEIGADATRLLARSMGSDDLRSRRVAFQLVAELPADARPGEVADGLNDPDPVVRLAAVRAVDASARPGRSALLDRVDDPDPRISAAAACRSLAWDGAGRARLRLEQLLRDDDPSVRRAVIEQSDLAPPTLAADLLGLLLGDPAPQVRGGAVERLADVAPDRALEPALVALRDPDPEVRLAGGRALGACGPRGVEPVLLALGDPRTSEASAEAARRLDADGRAGSVRSFVREAGARASDDRRLAAAIPDQDAAAELLRDAIVDRARREARSALWAAAMISRGREAMAIAIENLDGAPPQLANALETIETAGEPGLVRPLLALWEPIVWSGDEGVPWLSRAIADDDELIRGSAELVRARRGGVEMPSSPMTVPVIERVLLLRRVPLLADLTPHDLERIARIAEERGYADGETIAPEGELGEELFVIVEGTIRVIRSEGGGGRDVARRTAGDVVGEMSVITRAPRMASLVAEGPVRAIRIGHREFESMLRERPEVAIGVIRVLAQRLAEEPRPPGSAGG